MRLPRIRAQWREGSAKFKCAAVGNAVTQVVALILCGCGGVVRGVNRDASGQQRHGLRRTAVVLQGVEVDLRRRWVGVFPTESFVIDVVRAGGDPLAIHPDGMTGSSIRYED